MIDPPSASTFLEEVKRELQLRMRKEQYDSWFVGFALAKLEPREIEFTVPTGFVRDWLSRNYLTIVAEAVQAAGLRLQMIPLRIDPEHQRIRISVAAAAAGRGDDGTAVADAPPLAGEIGQVLEDLSGAMPQGASAQPAAAHAGSTNGHAFAEPARNNLGPLAESVLNPGYTFDQFVVGPCNRLPHAAALAIGENPGRAYNPLFVHGNTGLGKTHLLQGICHAVLKKQKRSHVLYLSCEDFTNRFIHAIQAGKLESFRAFVRGADVLVVDDIQFLANKERTQEEFFHTFNALYNAQKQIVISSDHAPVEIPTIEERLVSRFKWGLVAVMEQPCFDTRVAIVKRKARLKCVELPDDVAFFVAERAARNIRELEGAIVKVVGFAAIMDRAMTLELAEEALQGTVKLPPSEVTLKSIIDAITSEFSVSVRDLTGKSRSQPHTLPRHIAMFLARELTSHSLEEIGKSFGGRDHTTVLYSVSKVKSRSETDRTFRDMLVAMSARLRSRR